ncbi:MAG: cell division protein ZipA [Gammaproteobacteria bacterium]|nr:cell division protein ZipA [Gammaproteobacteria bacterium]
MDFLAKLDLQTYLIFAGILLIAAIVAHGVFKARRRSGEEPNELAAMEEELRRDRAGFDLDGVGEVRVRAEPEFGEAEEGAPAPREEDDIGETEPAEEVIVINVMSRGEEQFNGAIILQTLLSLGFRYGEMQIFHRHREARGKGPVLFSLANAVKPGVFDLDNLDAFYTPGLTLFMQLPGPQDPAAVYELMLDTAKRLAQELDGVLLDGGRSTLTHQAQQHDRERIRDFARRRMTVQRA